ncbi:MAG: TIGR00269 family protein [Methanosphaera sp. rholeuAM130]|nr:MAG: TIGR00269 family protein [Methanosphaera sp. rholeuAM130]
MKIEKESFNAYVQENVFNTITEYELIKDNQKIMIGVSGGKDSILTLHMLKEYQNRSDINFKIDAVCIDEGIAGYRNHGIDSAIANCKELDIDLEVISFKEAFGYDLDDIRHLYKSSCMPCGVYRRYLLNRTAYEHGCDRIATGHNMDDEIQSFLMTFARNDRNKFSKFGPVLDRIHEKMVPRIKPLWQLPEKDVGIWCVVNAIEIHDEECPYSVTSLRSDVKNFLNKLEEENRGIKRSIFNSFKDTFNLPYEKVKINTCTVCNQPTANSPCNACRLTEEINELLKE